MRISQNLFLTFFFQQITPRWFCTWHSRWKVCSWRSVQGYFKPTYMLIVPSILSPGLTHRINGTGIFRYYFSHKQQQQTIHVHKYTMFIKCSMDPSWFHTFSSGEKIPWLTLPNIRHLNRNARHRSDTVEVGTFTGALQKEAFTEAWGGHSCRFYRPAIYSDLFPPVGKTPKRSI